MTHNPDSNITMPCGTVHAARSLSGWSFDIEAIPRDRHIWAFTPGGDVLESWFIEPTKATPKGRWHNMNSTHVPVAWQPFVRPAPPAGHMAQPISPDLIPIIDDVGSGE